MAEENLDDYNNYHEARALKARNRAEIKIYEKLYYDQLLAKIELGDFSNFHPAFHDVLEKHRETKLSKPRYVFITINPSDVLIDEEKVQRLTKKLNKCVSKKWINWWAYVIEQRSETSDEFSGLHAHMLIDRGEKVPFEVQREFKSTFREICDVDNPHCLNFKYIPHEAIEQKWQYMLGNKKDEKQSKVSIDLIFREKFKLEPYYKSDAFPLNL